MIFSRKRNRDNQEHRNNELSDMHVESLENRQMLAGDVDVFVRGDNLIIRGDGDANEIFVQDNGLSLIHI